MRTPRFLVKRLGREQTGATAIEYGLIAGLIAIGIVGALVSTRTSLQSTFGTVNSGLAGNSGSVSNVTTPAQPSPIFGGKTLSTRSSEVRPWGATQYMYAYSDGSTAAYYTASAYRGTYYRSNMQLTDKATNLSYTYSPSEVDTTSGQTLSAGLSTLSYYASGNQKTYTNYSFDANGTSMTGTVQNYADKSGAPGTAGGTVTAQVSQFQGVIDQYNAYKANP